MCEVLSEGLHKFSWNCRHSAIRHNSPDNSVNIESEWRWNSSLILRISLCMLVDLNHRSASMKVLIECRRANTDANSQRHAADGIENSFSRPRYLNLCSGGVECECECRREAICVRGRFPASEELSNRQVEWKIWLKRNSNAALAALSFALCVTAADKSNYFLDKLLVELKSLLKLSLRLFALESSQAVHQK